MKNIIIKKIPLEEFIGILVGLYDSGANFVDLMGAPDGVQDTIRISVLKEYMEEPSSSFSEDNFNDLMI